MQAWMGYGAAVTCGYLAGSIPFGLLITKAAGLGDIRAIGSKSIGATNVLRTGRKDLALATLLLDSLKAGLVAFAFTWFFGREIGFVAGAMAFVGHCYPVWLGFKGGKGVATYAGLLPFTTLPGFCVAAPVWLIVFTLTRISSLAALSAAVLVPPGAWLLGERNEVVLVGLTLLSVFVFWTHRANIGRLLKGTEPRFGKSKAEPEA
ncbi:MAG: glycerol-3-phosphate 1-O-acyltransferase PlsY [Alphaproteobacteria bacterium]|nr:glycerol-3-phosphate 1-O-acyltransferase PlsY [Alphaproteobacteria bacterium]MBU2083559.1 glycerol-3-phosphate 1-O-acyltransferase PlsY [Alphaproteobacteria bacterium]MBU2143204.1 glycerol-3-phosphate 1-O-acyltransferase PlsY [Alphaproteobacteria bacterium]MBU2197833.1 glycerol-3-phosphate 1-O-acyltransferase PlsY [Alphaproteobacteria bacterium]